MTINNQHNWADHKLGFGKYAGLTYAAAAEDHPNYLEWMLNTFKHDDQRWIAANAVLHDEPIPELKPPEAQDETIRLVSFESGKISVQAPFSAKDRCKALSERKWSKPFWLCPAAIVEEVAAAFPDGEQSDGFKRILEEVRAVSEKATQTTSDFSLEHFGNGKELMPFQKAGLEFAEATGGNCLISDEMGLGKSVEALSYLALHPEMRPAVIVCPASLKLNWQREAESWLETDDRIEVINGGKVHELTKSHEMRAGIVIINYDILKKWLPELQRIEPEVLILDESHNCFPYETMVTTNQGEVAIGDIVENEMDVKVLCRDLCFGKTEWRKATHYFKSPKPISTIKINHEYGEIISTPNHRIWTAEGYITAEEIRSGTYLRVLRKTVHDSKEGKIDSEVLLTPMCISEKIGRSGVSQTIKQSNAKTDGAESLRVVRETLRNPFNGKDLRETAVLQRQLRGIMEDDAAGATGEIPEGNQIGSRGETRNEITRDLRADETKQSNAQPGNPAEGIRDIASNALQTESTGRERQTIVGTSTDVIGRVGGRLVSRVRSAIRGGGLQGRVPVTLQDRHSEPGHDDSDRSGRQFSLQPNITGSEKECEIIWSRVDYVEVLESSDIGRHGLGDAGCESVYNIEVEEHHNYFANGVLVSNCKNKKAARSKAAKALANVTPHKILLTGTPVLNRPAELWNQLSIISPNEYASSRFFNWHLRYADAKQLRFGRKTVWDFSGASNLEELAASLKMIMIRRTKEQVLPELPAKRRSTVLIPIDNRKEYEKADNEFLEWMAEQKGAEAAKRASNVEQLAKREYLKQVAIKGKMKAAIDWIKTFLASGEKLIVFGTHRSTIETIMSEFSECAVSVIGGMKAEAKDEAVKAFQNDPKVKLFIGNIQAAGQGLTLTAASNVAFLELADSPEMLKQCEDRAHRIGQDNAVNVYYLLAERTTDASIAAMLESKRGVIGQITEDQNESSFDLFDLVKED